MPNNSRSEGFKFKTNVLLLSASRLSVQMKTTFTSVTSHHILILEKEDLDPNEESGPYQENRYGYQ
jgi:hypothetical protein